MKIKLILALLIASHAGYSQNLFTKAITKLAKIMAPPAPTTAALSDVVIVGGIGSNLHPKELGTIYQGFFNDWKPGGDHVAFTFMKRDGSGFYKLDGTVTVNGLPAQYVSVGTYSIMSEPNPAPRKVEIKTTSGDNLSFVIQPYKNPVKVISINGAKEKIALDLTKDVVIELETAPGFENALLKVSLAINQVSIKSQYAVCYIRNTGSKITVPAAAFRNINIKPGGDAIYSYSKSFLSVGVETIEKATEVTGKFPEVKYTRTYDDGMFVKVSTEPDLNKGLVVSGKESLKNGNMEYKFEKPNAFTSRPAAHLKKIAVTTAAIRGRTFAEKGVITQEKDVAKGMAQVTKTTSITFPQQTNEVWDAALVKIYAQIIALVQTELGASVLPIDAAPKTMVYKSMERYSKEDGNSEVEFSRAYKGTKLLTEVTYIDGTSIHEMQERLMKELGTDALMTLTLSLDADQDGDFGVLIPTLRFELVGKPNEIFGTKYYTGTITGKGVPSENIGLKVVYSSASGPNITGRNETITYHTAGKISAEELDKIIRRSDILTVFAKALKEIREKEKANTDYDIVWKLKQ